MKHIAAVVLALSLTALSAPSASRAQSSDQTEDEESALLVEEARSALRERAFRRAGQLLDRALGINPRRIDAYVLRSSVHTALGEYDAGVALLRRARRLAPDNYDVLANLGSLLMLAKRPAEAVPILEKVVAQRPRRYQAQLALGRHYTRVGSWAAAVRAYRSYFAHRPEQLRKQDSRHRTGMANALLRGGQPREAQAMYRDVLRADPDNTLGRLGLAWSTAAIDCAKAMPLLRDMQDLAARHSEVLLVRGRCALILERVTEALSVARSLRERRPSDPAAWAMLGEALSYQGKQKNALAALERAVELAPESALYGFKLARVERRAGRHAVAAARLRARGAPPGFEDDWTLELGEALLSLDKPQEVRELLAPFLVEKPKHAGGNALLGIALLSLDDMSGAIEHLEVARAEAPTLERVRLPLIRAYNARAIARYETGDAAAARRDLRTAAQVAPYPKTWRNLGLLRLEAGDAVGALAVLDRSINHGDGAADVVTMHLLGRAYLANGKARDAVPWLRKAIAQPLDARHRADLAVDLSIAEVAAGDTRAAIAVLERTQKRARNRATRARLHKHYIQLVRKVATDEMAAGRDASAYKYLSAARSNLGRGADRKLRRAIDCDLALAATGANKRSTALKLLRALAKSKAPCPWVPPVDTLGVEILLAWNEGANLRSTPSALRRLKRLKTRGKGVAAVLIRTAAADIAARASIAAYNRGKIETAADYLRTARRYEPDSDELSHNQAVLNLARKRTRTALTALRTLGRRMPMALFNAGIAYDAQGDTDTALDYYRRARRAGVRDNRLTRWIDAKERIWGK